MGDGVGVVDPIVDDILRLPSLRPAATVGGFSTTHLRMVGRSFFVKHHDVLMDSERHPFGIEKAGGNLLLPNDVVTVELLV